MPDPINPSRPETGLPLTPTDTGVSEEIVQAARSAIEDGGGWFISSDDMRLALNAIAPRLKAEGLREFARKHKAVVGRYDDWTGVWNLACETMIIEADALSPPVKETK